MTRHLFVEANGLRFHVAEEGVGHRLALCLHGFPESSYSWRHQLPALARMGYRVWAPDLRGYGRSDRPRGVAAYAIDRLVEDAAALIDASGASEVTLLGHDWGGAIAWELAASARRPLERLVVMNCPHPMAMARALRSPSQLRRSWYFFAFQLPFVSEWWLTKDGAGQVARAFRGLAVNRERFPKEVLDEYRRNALEPGAATAMLNYYRAMFRYARRMRLRAPIGVPTLLVWGDADRSFDDGIVEETVRCVPGLEVRHVTNAGHWVQQDAPDEVNAILAAWLDGG